MNMQFISRPISGMLFVFLMTYSASSFSSARDIADTLYGSFNSTGPSSFTTEDDRKTYSGGAYSMRLKNKNIQVVNFNPPQASASCSGIDFFAGSLDMMSKDELVQVGRNIAAAATVYAFRLSLNSVCSSCNSIMTNIQSMMDRVNQMANINCEKALAAMETFNPSTPQGDTDKSLITTGVLNTTLNEWDEALANNENWLEQLASNNKTIDDIYAASPEMLLTMTDSGFFLAYNTAVPTVLFDFLPEEDARALAWSLLSKSSECPDPVNKKDNGVFCGLDPKYQYTPSNVFTGRYDSSSNQQKSLTLPKCREIKTVLTTTGQTYKYCQFNASGNAVVNGNVIYPIDWQFKKDAFGEDAIDTTGSLVTNAICANETITGSNDSLFSKMMTFNNSTLAPSQAALASNIGTKFTRDLYKFNAKQEFVASNSDSGEYAKDCALYANILFGAVEDLSTKIVLELKAKRIPIAIQIVNSNTAINESGKQVLVGQLNELEKSLKGLEQIRRDSSFSDRESE